MRGVGDDGIAERVVVGRRQNARTAAAQAKNGVIKLDNIRAGHEICDCCLVQSAD